MVDDRFPKDWKKKKLSDVGFSYSGLKSKSKKDFDEDGNAQFVTYRNINRNYFVDKHDLASVQVEEDENQNHVLKGDVLFTGSSETPEEVAFSSVMKEEIKNLYLNSFSFGYRFNNPKEFLPEFYGYYFRGPNFRKNVFPLAQGSTRYNLSKNEVLKIDIPVPSFKEQQKIASILSSVDETIEKTKQIIEQTNDLKNGVLQKLIARGIGHKKFKDSQVGKIPLSWEVKNFDELSTKILGGGTPSRKISDYYDGKIPWVTVKDLKDKTEINQSIEYITDLGLQNSAANLIPKGNLIISTRMAVGKALKNTADVSINQDMKGIIVDKSTITTDFFLYSYISKKSNIESMGSGTTVKGIRLDSLKKIKFAIPPLEEQEQITNIIKEIENKVYTEKQTLKNLILLKQGLMQQLLTGKVRVSINEEVPQ